ncbi:hypothetical protein [Paenibacillus crassostreae]|uniref:Uncharacterized protein n=1 Tax=Paenibacillus crassostreae TaxID=1763538 RepID=A0A167FMS6_9BACL|nr:hypothetical protein [Paenibacillus crassostreae]AOZ94245.1 hypothetical protein LPB68_19960 [Paenibacillus crassostreae]OAB76719.1 hypothetical protein PNBC_04780 [Paenibacillus crassostreae]
MGKLRINLMVGALGFVVTFLFTSINNLYMTSFIRALFAFAIWFILAVVFRWVIVITTSTSHAEADEESALESTHDQRGTHFDLKLPMDSEEINDLLKPKPESSNGGDTGFTPLNPPKLVSAQDPEQLAKAVRHLTEK